MAFASWHLLQLGRAELELNSPLRAEQNAQNKSYVRTQAPKPLPSPTFISLVLFSAKPSLDRKIIMPPFLPLSFLLYPPPLPSFFLSFLSSNWTVIKMEPALPGLFCSGPVGVQKKAHRCVEAEIPGKKTITCALGRKRIEKG